MSIVVPNISEILFLSLILGKQTQPQSQRIKLFKNPITPSETTSLESFVEADQSGYSDLQINSNDWTISQILGSTVATCTEKQFIFNEEATIYGYYIVSNTSPYLLMWAERFSSNGSNQFYQIPSGGGVIKITPKISID